MSTIAPSTPEFSFLTADINTVFLGEGVFKHNDSRLNGKQYINVVINDDLLLQVFVGGRSSFTDYTDFITKAKTLYDKLNTFKNDEELINDLLIKEISSDPNDYSNELWTPFYVDIVSVIQFSLYSIAKIEYEPVGFKILAIGNINVNNYILNMNPENKLIYIDVESTPNQYAWQNKLTQKEFLTSLLTRFYYTITHYYSLPERNSINEFILVIDNNTIITESAAEPSMNWNNEFNTQLFNLRVNSANVVKAKDITSGKITLETKVYR